MKLFIIHLCNRHIYSKNENSDFQSRNWHFSGNFIAASSIIIRFSFVPFFLCKQSTSTVTFNNKIIYNEHLKYKYSGSSLWALDFSSCIQYACNSLNTFVFFNQLKQLRHTCELSPLHHNHNNNDIRIEWIAK